MIEIVSKTLNDRTGEVTVFYREDVTLSDGEKIQVERAKVFIEGETLEENWSNADVEVAVRSVLKVQANKVKTVPREVKQIEAVVAEITSTIAEDK